MLVVLGHELTPMDRDTMKLILGKADILPHEIRFVDLKHEDCDILSSKTMLALGKVAIKTVVRQMVKDGMIEGSQFFGNDLVDEKNNFFFFNISLTTAQIMSSDDNKMYVWEKVVNLASHYRNWFPFSDNLDVINKTSKVEEEQGEPQKVQQEEPKQSIVISPPSAPVASSGELNVNVNEMLNALFEQVNLSDQGLGKSLSKYEKFTLHTSSGDLEVLPTSRGAMDEDSNSFLFRDLVALLKGAQLLGSTSITFRRLNDGSSNI